jgi:hypothetical protein
MAVHEPIRRRKSEPDRLVSDRVLEFAILTAAHSGEVRAMRWRKVETARLQCRSRRSGA